jgi:uncharacterized coiled-coil DUF342 family protein
MAQMIEDRINELAEQLGEIRNDLQEVKGIRDETQDWLDDAAVGEHRGGIRASQPERWRMEDRLRTLTELVAKEEARLASRQAEYDAAWAKLPADAFADDE